MGKPLAPKASPASRENHLRIGVAIQEVRQGLNASTWSGFEITRDSHYHLATRIAFAWKRVTMGVLGVVRAGPE